MHETEISYTVLSQITDSIVPWSPIIALYGWMPCTNSSLMGRLQKIVDRLYRIEGDQGHFHENGVPKGHGPIPESRKFQGLQLPSLLGLGGDKALFVVHKIQ